jgi:triosephosphate isomerase
MRRSHMAERKPVIAGNWKMNKTIAAAEQLVKELLISLRDVEDVEIAVCPPFTALHSVSSLLQGSNIGLGAQNMHFVKEGAYTGEVSPEMLKDVRCKYVIIGHSERRQYFDETDEGVNKKAKVALSYGFTPIICVGETLEQREQGMTEDLVSRQVRMALDGIGCESIPEIIIAYEPIWAIGTGRSATAEDAEHVISLIRDVVSDMFNKEAADKMRIQYGGSVNPKNIAELMNQPNIDGALVGGASLDADSFTRIVKY